MKKHLSFVTASFSFWYCLMLIVSPTVHAESPKLNGAVVFNNNCARCHNARSLDEFSLSEWAVIMPHMREKAHLTGKETRAVMQFISSVKKEAKQSTRSVQGSKLDGAAIFKQYSCQGCHQLNEQGGTVGPSLDSIIATKGKAFFKQKMINPQFNNPSSPMPKMPLSDAEIDALASYLSSH